MTRDMELIRQICLQIETREDVAFKPVEIDGVDPIALARHLEMLLEAGFIEGRSALSGRGSGTAPHILVKDLSWAGHDFLDAIKNDSVWEKLKQSFSPDQLRSLPLEVVKTVGIGILTAWAKQKAGI